MMLEEAGIRVLNVSFVSEGKERRVHPVLLTDCPDGPVLIDCGYPGHLRHMERVMPLPIESLHSLVLTHHDYDHMGAAFEIAMRVPEILVMASAKEKPYIMGAECPTRLARGARDGNEERAIRALMASVPPVRVDRELHDGDEFPWCGGAVIVATPGHTPGHISVYLKKHLVLIAGDALISYKGRLRITHPCYAASPKLARASARRLARLEIRQVVCYHGGVAPGPVRWGLNRAHPSIS